jgi:hypothetical protein
MFLFQRTNVYFFLWELNSNQHGINNRRRIASWNEEYLTEVLEN